MRIGSPEAVSGLTATYLPDSPLKRISITALGKINTYEQPAGL